MAIYPPPLPLPQSHVTKSSNPMGQVKGDPPPTPTPGHMLQNIVIKCSFAKVHVKGFVAFKHLKKILKHKNIQDMFILSIYVKLY